MLARYCDATKKCQQFREKGESNHPVGAALARRALPPGPHLSPLQLGNKVVHHNAVTPSLAHQR
jgi:hypothetical protein